MVIWFIGLSGSGKTTISNKFVATIKNKSKKHVIHLDGDEVRFLFENTDYSVHGREKNAKIISNLSKFLDNKNVIVVASVLSIFPEWQKWNRENIKDYFEIYIKVNFDILVKRDVKSLYKNALTGKIKNVVGVDIKFPEPNSDLVIENNKVDYEFDNKIELIFKTLDEKNIKI